MRRPRYFFCERAFPGKENYNVLLTTRPLSFWQSLKDPESQNIPSNYNCPLRLSAKTNVLQRTFFISADSPPHFQPRVFLSTSIQSEYFWVHLTPGLAPGPRYYCLAPLWSELGLTWNITLFSTELEGVSPPQVRPLRAPEKHWRGRKRWKVKVLVARSRPILVDPMDCSPPDSSVHGILQARILEWVAISSVTQGSKLGLLHYRHILYHLSHQEAWRGKKVRTNSPYLSTGAHGIQPRTAECDLRELQRRFLQSPSTCLCQSHHHPAKGGDIAQLPSCADWTGKGRREA